MSGRGYLDALTIDYDAHLQRLRGRGWRRKRPARPGLVHWAGRLQVFDTTELRETDFDLA
jgi:hypothetical protein